MQLPLDQLQSLLKTLEDGGASYTLALTGLLDRLQGS